MKKKTNKKEENNLTSLLKAQQEEFEKKFLKRMPIKVEMECESFLLSCQTQIVTAMKEECEKIKQEVRCGACDGARTGHTLGCISFQRLLSYLEDIK